jgi:hypothetical protein
MAKAMVEPTHELIKSVQRSVHEMIKSVLGVEREATAAGIAPVESEAQRQSSRIARRTAGDETASRGAFMNSEVAHGSPAWLHVALVGRDEDGCAETATRRSASDRVEQTSAEDARPVCPGLKRSCLPSDPRHGREEASAVAMRSPS